MMDCNYTLDRLALTFTVRDIMVSKENLICATDSLSAEKILTKHPKFDVVPIIKDNKITGYMERNIKSLNDISLHHVVSESTSILDSVAIFQKRKFFFVLSGQNLVGYVHLSDLNNHIVKLPFFVILEAVERHMIDKLGSQVSEDNLNKVLEPQRVSHVLSKIKKMTKNRSDIGLINILTFNEIIRFACYFHKLKLQIEDIEVISKVRNLVNHASNPLIESYEDVKRLFKTKEIAFSILNS
jgi:hypothetical protein